MFSWFTSKSVKSPELKEAESVFTEAELKVLQRQFREALAFQGGVETAAGGRAFAPPLDGGLELRGLSSLLGPAWDCLDPLLASRLQWRLADRADGRVRLSGLVIAKARAERLGEEASLEFTFGLLGADGRGASYRGLQAAVLSCLQLTGAVPRQEAGAGGSAGTATAAATATIHDGGPTASGSNSSSSNNTGGVSSSSGSKGSGGVLSDVQHQVAAICRGAFAYAGAACRGGAAGAALPGGSAAPDDVRLSYDEYCKWTKSCPALHKTLCALMRPLGASGGAAPSAGGTTGTGRSSDRAMAAVAAPTTISAVVPGAEPLRLPVLLQLGKMTPSATLLQPVWVWALSSRLPPAQRCEWRLLFNSQRDGKSFNTFFGRVAASPGPTLLLLRDAAGGLIGGVASQPWTRNGSFYGDVASYIFSLLPVTQVFPATGINDNFQWCGVGFSQLPAGLGFGGAAAAATSASARGHFALYVEPSLDTGMSRPMATYGNTPLASDQIFQIDTLECWLLQPPEDEQPGAAVGGGGGGGSILGKAAEDRAIMELAGLKLHSQGLRDEPLEED